MRITDVVRMTPSDNACSNSRPVAVALALLFCALPLNFVVLLITYAEQILKKNVYSIVSNSRSEKNNCALN